MVHILKIYNSTMLHVLKIQDTTIHYNENKNVMDLLRIHSESSSKVHTIITKKLQYDFTDVLPN